VFRELEIVFDPDEHDFNQRSSIWNAIQEDNLHAFSFCLEQILARDTKTDMLTKQFLVQLKFKCDDLLKQEEVTL
jgi:hypothetical protein